MTAPSKAVRVREVPFALDNCPVCSQPIEGLVTVEVHLGEVGVRLDDYFHRESLSALVEVKPRFRSMKVEHLCNPVDVPALGAEPPVAPEVSDPVVTVPIEAFHTAPHVPNLD